MSDIEETPELQADLSDTLRLVAELDDVVTMGRRGREILFALARAAADVHSFTGLVVDGDVHPVHWRKTYAACGCRDDRHEWKLDNMWFGRGHWHETEADAQEQADRVRGHVVTQITAYTPMQKVAR